MPPAVKMKQAGAALVVGQSLGGPLEAGALLAAVQVPLGDTALGRGVAAAGSCFTATTGTNTAAGRGDTGAAGAVTWGGRLAGAAAWCRRDAGCDTHCVIHTAATAGSCGGNRSCTSRRRRRRGFGGSSSGGAGPGRPHGRVRGQLEQEAAHDVLGAAGHATQAAGGGLDGAVAVGGGQLGQHGAAVPARTVIHARAARHMHKQLQTRDHTCAGRLAGTQRRRRGAARAAVAIHAAASAQAWQLRCAPAATQQGPAPTLLRWPQSRC
jgi:hypothetical protein